LISGIDCAMAGAAMVLAAAPTAAVVRNLRLSMDLSSVVLPAIPALAKYPTPKPERRNRQAPK
jgi:hypothetical protein